MHALVLVSLYLESLALLFLLLSGEPLFYWNLFRVCQLSV